MTKQERLSELKEQELLKKGLDPIFNDGWKNFVNGVRRENVAYNEEMYKVIAETKGQAFADDVRLLLKSIKEQYARMEIVDKPSGIELNDSRYKLIPKIWIFQKSGSIYSDDPSASVTGSLCIQLTVNRWIKINYTQIKKTK